MTVDEKHHDRDILIGILPDEAISEILTYLVCKDLCQTDASSRRLRTLGLEAWSSLERTLTRSKRPAAAAAGSSSSSSSSPKESFIKYHQASAKAKELQDVMIHKHGVREVFRACPKCGTLPDVNSTSTQSHEHGGASKDYDFFCRIARSRRGKERQFLFEGFVPFEETQIGHSTTGMVWRTDEAYHNESQEFDASSWQTMSNIMEFYTVAATTETAIFRMGPLRNLGGHSELKDALFGDVVVTILAVPKRISSAEGITLAAYAREYNGNQASYESNFSRIYLDAAFRDPQNPEASGSQSLYFAFELPRGGPARWLGIGLDVPDA
jgi:hypothetical protein